MNDNILTKKLRYFAEHGNIDMDRCIEIAQAANDALVEHSRTRQMPQLAAAMVRCCGFDEDETAYFRYAVDSFLQEKWGAKPKDSSVFIGLMDMAHQRIRSALQARQEDPLDDPDEEFDDEEINGDEEEVESDDETGNWHSDESDENDENAEDEELDPEIEILELRRQHGDATRAIDVDVQADLFDQIEGFRDRQIELLTSEVHKLHVAVNGREDESRLDWLGSELMAHLPRVMNQELRSLIERNNEAVLAVDVYSQAEIVPQIFENFARTIAKLAVEVALLRDEVRSGTRR